MKLSTKKINAMISYARTYIGVPYKYGATMNEAPVVFDCSGFIKYIFSYISIELPRSSIEQASVGKIVKGTPHLLPGDIIFLRGSVGHYNKKFPQGIGHVVLYIGDNKVIHASSRRTKHYPNIIEVGKVRIDNLPLVLKRSGPITVIKRFL